MEVLKNSEKFSVFRIKQKNKKEVVIKIAHKNPKKILREIKLLKKLCLLSKFFKSRIPKIINSGIIKRGPSKNKGYYKQNYIKGFTFSQIIQNKKISKNNLNFLLKNLLDQFVFITRDTKQISKKNNSLKYIKNLIKIELVKLRKKNLLLNVVKSKNIYIEGKKYNNIKFYLDNILNSRIIKNLNNHKFLAEIGHWNFHGGNIIFPTKKNYKKFHLIDPDATWKFNDPFFSLSRFIYTFPHDTMENDKYSISSNNFKLGSDQKKINFKIKNLWRKNVQNNYIIAFGKFYSQNFKNNPLFKALTDEEYLRYNLTLILCFMRGINSNYEQKINFLNKKSSIFQNKSIYLYLLTLINLRNFKNFINYKYDEK
jgi:hypothetical protein